MKSGVPDSRKGNESGPVNAGVSYPTDKFLIITDPSSISPPGTGRF
jgi:hypothetical protein